MAIEAGIVRAFGNRGQECVFFDMPCAPSSPMYINLAVVLDIETVRDLFAFLL